MTNESPDTSAASDVMEVIVRLDSAAHSVRNTTLDEDDNEWIADTFADAIRVLRTLTIFNAEQAAALKGYRAMMLKLDDQVPHSVVVFSLPQPEIDVLYERNAELRRRGVEMGEVAGGNKSS